MTGVDEGTVLVGSVLHQRTTWTCPRCRDAVVTLLRQRHEETPPSEEDGVIGVD